MPRLYCEQHGKKQDARCQERQEDYREAGETVLIISGPLKSGPWQCDTCNATLNKAMTVSSNETLSHYRRAT